MSAADPWMGALSAARSAAFLALALELDNPGKYLRRPNKVSVYPTYRALLTNDSR